MSKHAQGFNWCPFRRSVSELCAYLGIPVTSGEVGRLVEIRNDWAHTEPYAASHSYCEESLAALGL